MLDKSRKIVSCVRVDYGNKTQMLLKPSVQFFIDARGLLLIGRKGMHYVQLKFASEHCFHMPITLKNMHIQTLLLSIKALYLAAFYNGG